MGGSQELATEVDEMEKELEETDERRLAVCLVSGGMDSCVTAAVAPLAEKRRPVFTGK